MNLYLPNEGQVTVLETCLNIVHQNKEGILLMGGDLNKALDPTLNVSKGTPHLSYVKLPKEKRLMQELQVVDS